MEGSGSGSEEAIVRQILVQNLRELQLDLRNTM